MSWLFLERDGTRLACGDFGGDAPPALLVHGLAGHAGEWAETAGWLTQRRRVLGLDVRGHGRSERAPADVSRAAHVGDAVYVIERLELGPVVLVGQSLGGHTALLVAAERPDLVTGLVVADVSPARAEEGAAVEVGDELKSWPVPFASREAGGGALRRSVAEGRRMGGWARATGRRLVAAFRRRRDGADAAGRRRTGVLARVGAGALPGPGGARRQRHRPRRRCAGHGRACRRRAWSSCRGPGTTCISIAPGEWRAAVIEFLDSLGV